ncbi:Protein of unknown function [Salinihabitans flavidus]|uniref:DUF2852 domain-containing protein n=1 Tax=Salinihabitans flavidus TaxID=569882 RepID=A0A1H8N5A9_9RHOB|nr:DUF2852 domain-containing protein [Salinihabitans flavidus]SEO24760.1 Protein of unknown function [Salinihabitans flavidus]
MTSYATTAPPSGPMSWLARAEDWLDSKGKGAWIAVMVLGFIAFWPVGLALLFYMIWSKQMFGKSCTRRHARRQDTLRRTGNSAFDAYREDTLRRLEEEQAHFESFLERLRAARDKAEFDQFMDERATDARDREAPQA